MKKSHLRKNRFAGRFHQQKPRRPHFEKLEDRWLLSAVGFNSLSDVTLAAGTTMFIPLNSTDAGQTVSYAVTASDYSKLTPNITPQTNKTLQFNVLINGVSQPMDFQLFDNLAPTTTAKIEQLVNSGFYNGLQIYRNGKDGGNPFVLQGGNIPPTGPIKTEQPSIAEEFNPNLQYTTADILAMARAGVPGSTSTEFFVTEEPTRFLDFNYTMFGFQTGGTSVDQTISAMADENSTQDPSGIGYLVNPVTISSASIFTDTQNGVLELRAPGGVSGTVTVTVTASDGTNTPTPHSFTVTIQPDSPSNPSNPFASVIPATPTSVAFLPGSGGNSQSTNLNNSGGGETLQFQVSGVTSGNLVEILADGNVIGQATANGNTVTVTTDGSTKLADGFHTFTALQIAPHKTVTVNEYDSSSQTGATAEPETADVPSFDSSAIQLTINSAAPTVTAISPTAGPLAGGTSVTITGTNLAGATAVTFGTTTVTTFTSDTDTQIVLNSPAGSAGPVDVTVTTADGTSATSVGDQFTYVVVVETPTVTSIDPTQGAPAGGRQVMIVGSGFSGATAVDFGSTPAAAFTVVSDTQIKAVSPAGTGVVDVTVVTPDGTSATSSADQFSYAGVISVVTPSQGPAAGGTQVTIWGANFSGATAVNFGNTAAASFTVVSDNEVTATSPAGSGVVDVTVVTAGGTSATSSGDQFSYVTVAAPAVTSLNPSSGLAVGGTLVTITGTGFTGATVVDFGDNAAAFTVVSDTEITATSPVDGPQFGLGGTFFLPTAVGVSVTTPAGTSGYSSGSIFTYLMIAPTVTAVSPTSGPASGGTTVTIIGTGFTGATAVDFGNMAATFIIDSDTQITATSPVGIGTVDVTVSRPGGTSATSSADQFAYTAGPLNLVVTTLDDNSDSNSEPGKLSLREALALANANPGADTISFASSLDGGTITLSLGELAITDSVTIEGLGAADLTINANNRSRVFDVNDGSDATTINVEIDGLTLTGGLGSPGGAVYSVENLTLDSVDVTGNTAQNGEGGGIYADTSGTTTIRNSTISNNSGGNGGGIYVAGSGEMLVQGCTISDNFARQFTFSSWARNNGGISPDGTIIIGGPQYYGGGIYGATSGTATIEDSTISENGASSGGGGIYTTGTGTTIEHTTVSNNNGGGIWVATGSGSTTTIQNSTISGNSSSMGGGGIDVDNPNGGTTTIQGSTITGNSDTYGGGGIRVIGDYWATTTIENSTVAGNSATDGEGGGIFVSSSHGTTTTIQNSTITGNSTPYSGGGIFALTSYGGTVYGGTVTIRNSTITGNSASFGGGIYAYQGVSVASSIIAGNINHIGAAAPDVSGPLTLSNSLVGDNTGSQLAEAPLGAPDANGNFIGGPLHGVIDPKLGPLADNGGPTETCALLVGSPAIDTGSNPANLAYDQRGSGYPRVLGAQADMGAYEAAPSVAVPTVSTISPAWASTAGGTTVTIVGTSLAGATAVRFGNVAGTIQSDTATQIVVIAPAGTVGTVDVTVTTGNGTSATSSADRFTYLVIPSNLVVTTLVDKLDTNYDPANLSLREALALANADPDANTISFAPSLDGGTISLSLGELAITDSVTIEGPGAAELTINANSQSRIFDVGDGSDATNISVEIDGLTLTGGRADDGGAVYSSAENLALNFVNITGNTANISGAGVYALVITDTPTEIAIQNCTISENSAIMDGGGIYVYTSGALTIQNDTISQNTAYDYGGGISATVYGGTSTIQNCSFTGNSAGMGGGGVWAGALGGGAATIQNSTISGNSSGGPGGGIFLSADGTATIEDNTISGNSAVSGGGVYAYASQLGSITIQRGTISGNSAGTSGGGISVDSSGATAIEDTIVSGNTASSGGDGIYATTRAGGTTVIEDSTISGNGEGTYRIGRGGGIYVHNYGTTTIESSLISGNSATWDGGGIYATTVRGTTTINDSTISGNNGYFGGGICATQYGGATIIQNSTISGNSASGSGGGMVVYSRHGGLTTIQNSTISGNSAGGSGGGIAADSQYGNTTTIQNSTITGNISDSDSNGTGKGGGIYYTGEGTASVTSTIIAGNIDHANTAPDVFGLVLLSHSLVGDDTGSGLTEAPVGTPDSIGNLIGGPIYGVIDAKLGPLADNGGPTQTCALLAGSPAIEMGSDPAGLAYDQRGSGYPRVLGAQADIGAYEAAPSLAAPRVKAVSPTSGSTAGGTLVTITGTNLAGATAVKFGRLTATIQSDTGTQIIVIAPAGVVGIVDVTVTTANGTSVASSADRFTYVVAVPAPTLTAISRTSGSTVGGTTVTITGTNLTGATVVKFGNLTATIQSVTATQIVVIAPAGAAGIVDVTVTTAGGTSACTTADRFTYIAAADTPTVGLYDPFSSLFMLRNTNDSGLADEGCSYGVGNAGMLPIVGDWNGDGVESIGLFDPVTSTFYLRNTNCLQGPNDHGYADTVFVYGPANAGDEPVVGDWNGDGRDSVGLFDPSSSTFYLRNTNCLQGPNDHGYADIVFNYGPANGGMLPVAGDWDGSGRDGVGLYSQVTSTFYLRETTRLQGSRDKGYADAALNYGVPQAGLLPLAGDWNGDGRDGIGLYDQSTATFFLRNSIQLQGPSDRGFADLSFTYGKANRMQLPVAGDWTEVVGSKHLLAAGGEIAASPNTPVLTQAELQPIVNAAMTRWTSAGLDVTTLQKLRQVQFVIGDLPGSSVGEADGNLIQLDANAAGHGWFIDSTPASDEEFASAGSSPQLSAVDPQALDRIDLLTVVEHELGHVAGLQDLDALADDVMSGTLGTGIRRNATHTDAVLAAQ